MSAWTLFEIGFNIFFALALFMIVMRLNRAPKDDPRLSRGLQLLQAKISVLEDLSDRTETQVSQLVSILESKQREIQAKVQLADQTVQAIKVSMDRSLEVAKIFQDRIPHQEIIERQNTLKYVEAARLAHQGADIDEIAKIVDLPKGEIEFIASVNRERLLFNENELPPWARPEAQNHAPDAQNLSHAEPVSAKEPVSEATRMRAEMELAEQQKLVDNLNRLQFEMKNLDLQLAQSPVHKTMGSAFEPPKVETATLEKLGEEFRKAIEQSADRMPMSTPSPAAIGSAMTGLDFQDAKVDSRLESTGMKQASISSQVANASTVPQAPVLSAQEAHQKLQAALRATQVRRSEVAIPAELAAAREVARDPSVVLRTNAPASVNSGNSASSAVQKRLAEQKIVKRVIFPRLDRDDV